MKRALLALGLVLAPSLPATAETGVRPFKVPSRPGLYAVAAQTQQLGVRAADGTEVFNETWLPARNGPGPPWHSTSGGPDPGTVTDSRVPSASATSSGTARSRHELGLEVRRLR